jgi:hypothetical protein
MTLRDDAIFLGFLIQCYLYRVDKSRCNEFGYAYEIDTTKNCASSKSAHNEDQSNEDLPMSACKDEPELKKIK